VDFGPGVIDLRLGAEDALVAGGDVEIAVHRHAAVGGDVVVEAVSVHVGAGVGTVQEIGAIDADGIFVGKDAEFRGVVDVELAVDVLHAEDRVEPLGEDGDVAIGMNDQDAIGRIAAGTLHVHRVFSQEDAAIGGGEEDRGKVDLGVGEEDVELPIGGDLPGFGVFLGRRGFGRGTSEGGGGLRFGCGGGGFGGDGHDDANGHRQQGERDDGSAPWAGRTEMLSLAGVLRDHANLWVQWVLRRYLRYTLCTRGAGICWSGIGCGRYNPGP
jgi:hypothetical protein